MLHSPYAVLKEKQKLLGCGALGHSLRVQPRGSSNYDWHPGPGDSQAVRMGCVSLICFLWWSSWLISCLRT